jgi:hypothetical protein
MKGIVKNISLFFILLAWLVLTAHMIIPHDHHFAESVNGQGDTCPVSENSSERHSGLPVHCHALNDLTSEKTTIFFFKDRVYNNDLFLGDFTDIFVYNLNTPAVAVFDIRRFFPDSHLLYLAHLRAPPCLS